MTLGDRWRLTRQSLNRHGRDYLISAVGVAAAIAAFVFFLALSFGVRRVVLGDVFPVDRLEIVPQTFDLGPLRVGGADSDLTAPLDTDAIEALQAIPGVRAAFPKLKLSFKCMGWIGAEILGRNVRFEVFADGVHPDSLDDGDITEFSAVGLDDERKGPGCKRDDDCHNGRYCAEDKGRCIRPIPLLISPHLIELYNGSAVRAFRTPKITPDLLVGLSGTLQMGRSFAGREVGKPVLRRKAKVVGISNKAMQFGATMPLEYVRHYNRIYRGEKAGSTFDSAVLLLDSAEVIPALSAAIEALGFTLDEPSKIAQRAGWLLSMVSLALLLIALSIMTIAALHVAHGFMMVVLKRRKEMGLWRALGASRSDLVVVVLLEAACVGLLAGLAGYAMAYLGGSLVDWLAATALPDFPFKPDTFFHFPWPLLLAAPSLSVLFCVLGALGPAWRAGMLDPGRVLYGEP